MKKLTLYVCALGLSLLALTGCGGKKDAADNGKVTLNIYSSTITEKPESEIEQKFADEYMKANPKIKINYIGSPINDTPKKITTLATSNDLPDAFYAPSEFISKAVDMGIVADLNDILDKDYIAGFNDGIVESSTIDKKFVIFPWATSPLAIVYNKKMFEAEGLSEPKNFDEFLDVAKKLTKDTDNDGKVDQWGFSMVGLRNGSGENRFIAMARNFGVDDVVEKDEKWATQVGSDNYKEALKYFVELSTKYGVVPPGAVEAGYPEAANFFATEKTGMMLTGSNALGVIVSQNPELEGNLGSFIIPEGKRQVADPTVGGYSITSTSKHKKEMADYLKFLVEKENALEFTSKTGRMPTRKDSMDGDVLKDAKFAGFLATKEYPYSRPNFPSYPEMYDVHGEAYATLLSGQSNLDDVVKAAKERAEKLVNEANK